MCWCRHGTLGGPPEQLQLPDLGLASPKEIIRTTLLARKLKGLHTFEALLKHSESCDSITAKCNTASPS